MAVLKLFGKRIGGPKEEDFKKRISADDKIGPNLRSPSRMARQDFSESTSKGPNMGKINKVTKKEITVETPEGEYGSVNREDNPEAMGPNFTPIKEVATEKEMDLQDKARRSMGFKKGGKVGSASKRADGIATKGKTRGRII